MRVLVCLACVLSLAWGQTSSGYIDILQQLKDYFNDNKNDYVIDYVHNYRLEDHGIHGGKHILIAISDSQTDKTCHIIEVAKEWENYLVNDDLHKLMEELYQLLTTHTAQETELSLVQLQAQYGDGDALRECYRHTIYLLTYTPSFTLPPTVSGK